MDKTLFFGFLFLISLAGTSQQRFKGKILNEEDKTPVPYASIVTIAARNANSMSDTGGSYNLWYSRSIKITDSVVVSAIGYRSRRIALNDLTTNTNVFLTPNPNMLENVVVVSTLRGSDSNFGYFRSWREKNNTGEIGQLIDIPSNKVQIGTVQVKINKNYDTCWLKLHIRSVGPNGFPEQDLLQRDVVVPATVNNGLVEFELDWQTFKFPNTKAYVGFEVVDCTGPKTETPSFLFTGSEEGTNLYRDWRDGEWQVSEQYTIYIRLLMK